jgi:hypothetical protein
MKKKAVKKSKSPAPEKGASKKGTSKSTRNTVKSKVFPALTFDKEPSCFCQGVHENDCLNCVFIGRCLYDKVAKDIAVFKEKSPEEYAKAKVRLNDLTYLYKEISASKM